jgi:squalene synthase HpnC
METAEAYQHCLRLARQHYENFPVASHLLRQDRRQAVAAIYAFARQADDYADEPPYGPEPQRLALLGAWEAKLDAPGEDPVFVALADACQRFRIPRQLLIDLLNAFRQDVRGQRYADFAGLQGYCRLSANPVGRLVLAIHGRLEPELALLSDEVCTGLQLANFLQDMKSDALERSRIYLPADEMAAAGVAAADLRAMAASPALRALVQAQVARTRGFFERGADLPGRLGGLLGLEIRLTLLGGSAILDTIQRQGFDTLRARPKLGKARWLGLLARALAGGRR